MELNRLNPTMTDDRNMHFTRTEKEKSANTVKTAEKAPVKPVVMDKQEVKAFFYLIAGIPVDEKSKNGIDQIV